MTSPSRPLLPACVLAALGFMFSAPVASAGDAFTLLKDINVGTYEGQPLGSYPTSFARVGPWVYFIANATTDYANLRLWRTDGTPAGTAEVPGSPVPQYGLKAIGDDLFFVGWDQASGTEVWKLDAAGTFTRLTDICSGPGGSQAAYLTEFKGAVYFRAWNGSRYGLWKVGPSGAEEVKPLYPAYYAGPFELTVLNDHLFFAAFSDDLGLHLWRTDGTAGETRLVGPPSMLLATSSEIAVLNGALLFPADDASDPDDGLELWTSDGNPSDPGGTHRIKDIYPGWSGPPGSYNRTVNSSSPMRLTEMNGALYFVAASSMDAYGDPCDPTANPGSCRLLGQELWKTDGTADGTLLVNDISELGSSEPWNLTLSGGLLYFTADDGVAGRELWRSDGTGVGTLMVADVCSLDLSSEEINVCGVAPTVAWWGLHPSSSNPGGLTDVNGRLHFAAYDKDRGRELFRVTAAGDGVELVADLYPGVSEQSGTWLCPYGPCLLPNSGLEAAGPSGSFSTLDGKLFLSADDGQHGFEPWVFRSLTPAEQIAQIVVTVDGLVDAGRLNLGQGKSLVGKLELALHMLEYGNAKKAVTMLEAFIQEVEAFQRGGVLDDQLAQDLIGAAQAAIASLAG